MKDPNLLCAQIPGLYNHFDDKYKGIINNTDPQYKRESVPEGDLPIAFVNAKDIAKPDDLALDTATCLIKMGKPSLEGLRQAFLDPSSRIRLYSEKEKKPRVEFKEISWKGGFLKGYTINFNKNLNTIIGGRGSGKSTVIESLRYVLGVDIKVPEIKKNHKSIVKEVLRDGTQVTLLVQVNFPIEKKYWIQSTIPNEPNISLVSEPKNILQHKPIEMFPNLQIFGQHELSEFTRHPKAITDLLKKFVDLNLISDIEERKQKIKFSLEESRINIIKLEEEKSRVKDSVLNLKKKKEKLDVFDKENFENKHSEKIKIIKEKHLLETTFEKVEKVENLISTLKQNFLETKYLENFSSNDQIVAVGIIEIQTMLENLQNAIRLSAQSIEEAKKLAFEEYNRILKKWQERFDVVENAYLETLRKVQEDEKSFDSTKIFIELRTEIESLNDLSEMQKKNTTELNQAKQERASLVSAWNKIKSEELREMSATAEKISKEALLENRVRVEVKFSLASEGLSELFKVLKGARIKDIFDRLDRIEGFSLSDFANNCREGAENLVEIYDITETQANLIIKAGDSFWMSVEEAELPITTIIELNISSNEDKPSWKKLGDLSTGQKATALLLLLLIVSQDPLIIDQPEDDLDNRFITDTIVSLIKQEKFSRQIIFTTHNANIPVLGDAELIIGMPSNIQNGNKKLTMGSLDLDNVREMVEEVLEGGKQAFERRREKYGF